MDVQQAYQRWTSERDETVAVAGGAGSQYAESVREMLEDIDVSTAIKHVLGGEFLLKFRRHHKLQHFLPPRPRFFQVYCVDGEFRLSWESGRQKITTSICLSEVEKVIPGCDSAFMKKRRKDFACAFELAMTPRVHMKRGRRRRHKPPASPDEPRATPSAATTATSHLSDNQPQDPDDMETQLDTSRKSLRLICPSIESWKLWLVGLTSLVERTRTTLTYDRNARICAAINSLWNRHIIMDKESPIASPDDIIQLLKDMMYKCDVRYLALLINNRTHVEYLEFETIIGRLLTQADVLETFYRITQNRDLMTEAELISFMQDVQLESGGVDFQQMLMLIPQQLAVPNTRCLSDVGFCMWVMSEHNSICNPASIKKLSTSMNNPLTSYWIKTYHNPCFAHSWCLGNPMSRLQRVLRDGYRCLEFDVFEAPDGRAVVPYNCKPPKFVALDRVLRLVKEEAFKHTPYPLLIFFSLDASLGVCAGVGQQLKVVFGKELVLLSDMAAEPGDKSEGKLQWDFVPNQFLNKIVVGGKRVGLHMRDDDKLLLQAKLRHLELEAEEELDLEETCIMPPRMRLNAEARQLTSAASQLRSGVSSEDRRGLDRSKGLLALELRAYVESIILVDSLEVIGHCPHRTVINCSAAEFAEAAVNAETTLVRVSPYSLLSTLTAAEPCKLWARGVQMVAHCASPGVQEWLQKGRFLENGRCGYVLKGGAAEAGAREYVFKVLGARQVATTCVRRRLLRVTVSVYEAGSSETRRTKTVASWGVDPRWSERLVFEVRQPGRAMVVFAVQAEEDGGPQPPSSGFALPAAAVRAGLRWVPLWDLGGAAVPWSGLLVAAEVRALRADVPAPAVAATAVSDAKKAARRLSVAPQALLHRRASLAKIASTD